MTDINLDNTKSGTRDWSPKSWKAFPANQQPVYSSQSHLEETLEALTHLPPLVHTPEIDKLQDQLAAAAKGECFLLQGGDCAELFSYCNATQIQNKLKILLQMSLILVCASHVPVVRLARMAGQYAKPRSNPKEVVNGVEVLAYRGDIINGMDLNDREPDPNRLKMAYMHSGLTLNYVRALVNGGFSDLRHPSNWDLSHVISDETRGIFEGYAKKVMDSLDFMDRILHVPESSSVRVAEFYTSHEGMLLDFETAMTRLSSHNNKYYNMGAHFLWIGDRTRAINGAHVEYFRGIANPIGIKVGPTMKPDELVELLNVVDPDKVPGHVTLITRYGADKIRDCLPAHIRAVEEAGLQVVWCCDPMHGNTELTADGIKTRRFDSVLLELRQAFEVHREMGRQLNGVHFELAGDNVTECMGGTTNLSAEDLSTNYQSFCDPRLNYSQGLDMAFLIAGYFHTKNSNSMAL